MTYLSKYTYQYLLELWDELYLRLVYHFRLDDIPRFYSNSNVNQNILSKLDKNKINYKFLSANKNISLKFILDNLDLPWSWRQLSRNKNITLEFVDKFREKNWSWIYLTRNLDIKEDDILNYPWYHFELSRKIPFCMIQRLPECKVDMNGLSCNPSVTFEIIKMYPEMKWNYRFFSINPNITLNIVLDNFDLDWDWKCLTGNPSITILDIINNAHLPWDYSSLSQTEKYDFLDVINNNLNICPFWLSKNSFIDWDTFKTYENKIYWSVNGLSWNINMDPETILDNSDYSWDKYALAFNSFRKGKERWINRKRLEIITSFRIQRWWRYYSCNPKYRVARKIIMREIEK